MADKELFTKDKFNFDDFRVKDLDELVPLIKPKFVGFDAKRLRYSRFVLSKDARVTVSYDKDTDETEVVLSNPVIRESRIFGGRNAVPFEAVDIGSVIENFIVFDYLVSSKSIFRKKAPDALKTHLVLTNIDSVFDGKPEKMSASFIVSEEDYDKAMTRAKKAFDKEQSEVIHSQTPEYDT